MRLRVAVPKAFEWIQGFGTREHDRHLRTARIILSCFNFQLRQTPQLRLLVGSQRLSKAGKVRSAAGKHRHYEESVNSATPNRS